MTVSNLEKPPTVMVPTIALYHSGVEAMVSSLSFFYLIVICFVCLSFFFSSLCPSVLVKSGVATMPTIPFIFDCHSFLHVTTLTVLFLLPFSVVFRAANSILSSNSLNSSFLPNSNSDGRVVRASASGAVDAGLIPSRLKPMTLKLVFTASLLDA